MKLLRDDRAWEDHLHWQGEDKKTLKRMDALLKEMMRAPYEGTGRPEPLGGDLSGWRSRRLADAGRIVHKQDNESIRIAACKGRYDER